jgi:hypothetical protein
MDMPDQEGSTLGKASRRKRERRLGRSLQPFHSPGQISEPPYPLAPLPGRGKISACLIEMVRPLLPPEVGIAEWRMGIAVAALAWNLALLPAAERVREIERMVRDPEANDLGVPFLLDLLLVLIAQKLRLYPDDPRLVLSYDVRKIGSGRFHITAMAGLPE